MTSSSSLYGTVTTQNSSSTNSTSLYGEAGTPIPDSSGNLIVRGDLWVLSGNILTTANTGNIFPANATTINLGNAATTINIGADSGTTNINNDLNVDGGITAGGADLGNITIAVVDNNTISTTTGSLKLGSNTGDIGLIGADTLYTDQSTFLLLNSPTTVTAFDSATVLTIADTSGVTFIRNDVTVGGDLKINGNDIKSNGGTVAITLSGNDVTIADDLTINGNNVNLAQATVIGYSEANDRANRPTVRSTTGNSSGFRVEAPNATTSAASSISAFSTNDVDNGKFINISARGTTTNDLRIQTGLYTAGVLGPSGTVVSFVDNITAYATVNPAGPTDPLDLTTKAYVDSITPDVPTYDTNVAPTTGGVQLQLRELNPPTIMIVGTTTFLGGTNITISETNPNEITIDGTDLNTTYTQNASTTTGGANLNLVGSDATTDTIKFAEGTNVTITATDANTITISAPDTNTTYTIDASSTTGGANLNLVGSDASTDTVKVSSGTGVTVAQVSANELSVAIGQAVGTSDSVTFADVTLDSIVNLNTATLTTSTTAADQVADSFVAATYRTCKYVIQVTSGSAYQAVEALLVHDGSTAYINTYSDVRTGANLTSINAAVNGANIELQVTPVNAATTYKISKTLIAV